MANPVAKKSRMLLPLGGGKLLRRIYKEDMEEEKLATHFLKRRVVAIILWRLRQNVIIFGKSCRAKAGVDPQHVSILNLAATTRLQESSYHRREWHGIQNYLCCCCHWWASWLKTRRYDKIRRCDWCQRWWRVQNSRQISLINIIAHSSVPREPLATLWSGAIRPAVVRTNGPKPATNSLKPQTNSLKPQTNIIFP